MQLTQPSQLVSQSRSELQRRTQVIQSSDCHETVADLRYSLEKTTIDIPVLFIQATKDGALPPAMSANMDKSLPHLTRREVDTNHWALWEAPEQVNGMIKGWLEEFVFGGKSSL